MALRIVLSTIVLFLIVGIFSSILVRRVYKEARDQMLYNELRIVKTSKPQLYKMLAKTPRAIPLLRAVCKYHMTVDEDWAAALAHSRAMTQYAPKEPLGYSLQASALLGMGDLAAADRVLETGIRKIPRDMSLAHERAQLAEKRQLPQVALDQWQGIQQRFPNHHRAHIGVAQMLIAVGRAAEAQPAINKALALEPRNENALRTDAECAEACGDWPGAVEKWRSFRERSDSKSEGYMRGAAALHRLGRAADERELLESVCNLFETRKDVVTRARERLAVLDNGQGETPPSRSTG